MYLEYTTKQLIEYNKLIKIIESCETPKHHSNTVDMMTRFGKICDRRQKTLQIYAIRNLLKFNTQPLDEYYKYKNATKEQVETLINYSNTWVKQYEAWGKKQESEMQANKDYRGDKIDVIGFAKLLKKKRKK